MAEDMQINAQRAKQLAENIASITSRIDAARQGSKQVNPFPNPPQPHAPNTRTQVRLIAVSKLKPANDILALHNPASSSPPVQTHFGENYVQELIEKSKILPRSIQWHMIGGLQSNKCKQLAEQIPNLWCVSSVDSEKKANELEKGRKALVEKNEDGAGGGEGGAKVEGKLRVKVQVNTSGEENKSGVEPSATASLCRHIREKCPHLQLHGLMTIGAIARSKETSPENENEDFVTLRETRDRVAKELGLQQEELELSMGMSADFEGAIRMGSDEVRVGSQIFGERPQKKDAVVKEKEAQEKS
jgi:pyridoxal phosphate enzyme (YggS family)